jgi:subtilisin family serine protease
VPRDGATLRTAKRVVYAVLKVVVMSRRLLVVCAATQRVARFPKPTPNQATRETRGFLFRPSRFRSEQKSGEYFGRCPPMTRRLSLGGVSRREWHHPHARTTRALGPCGVSRRNLGSSMAHEGGNPREGIIKLSKVIASAASGSQRVSQFSTPRAVASLVALILSASILVVAAPARASALQVSTLGVTAAGIASLNASPAQVLADAPTSGPVTVSVQVIEGNVAHVESFTAASKAAAAAFVTEAQRIPGAAAVAVDQTVSLADGPDAPLGSSLSTGSAALLDTTDPNASWCTAGGAFDDTDRGCQWALTTLHAETVNALVDSSSEIVAVIDTGVNVLHQDFAPGQILPGEDLVSSDGISYDADPAGLGQVDPNGHGTHVAGIIAATQNNGLDIAGLSKAKILPIRVMNYAGSGSSANIAAGIDWAADHGANVINLSVGGTTDDPLYTSAVAYANAKNVVVVAAAGNGGPNGPALYPGATPGVLAVAATDINNAIASFSTAGSYVGISAPGVNILSLNTWDPTGTLYLSGTSMATPYVAASAALAQAAHPTDTESQIVSLLESTATPLGVATSYGAGLVNPLAAVTPLGAPDAPSGLSAAAGDGTVGLSWSSVSSTLAAPVTGYRLYRSDTVLPIYVGTATSFTDVGLTNGDSYSYSATAYGPGGESIASSSVSAAPVGVPSSPTGPVASAGNAQVSLAWAPVTSTSAAPVAGYHVYRSGAGSAIYTGTAASFTDIGLTNGTSYSYWVTTYGPGGESGRVATTPAAVTPVNPAPVAPAQPTGSVSSDLSATVSFGLVAGATSYTVTMNPGNLTATGAHSPITVNGLASDTTYTFTVTATNAAGSSTSPAASLTTPASSGGGSPGSGSSGPGPSGTAVGMGVTRIAGTDRIDTAIKVSVSGFTAGSAGSVVLARADQYADALAGAPLAVDKNGPLLLTPTASLDPRVLAEIQRVLPNEGTVYLLGGTSSLSPAITAALTSHGYQVVRVAGVDRFDTAVKVADLLGDPSTVFLASGTNFPDSLSAGAAAAHENGVLLLTDGSTLPPETASYLANHPGTAFAIGGPAAKAYPAATPIVGTDRYQTSVLVASAFFPSAIGAGLTSGLAFADALSAGPALARLGFPLLLTDPNTLPPEVTAYLSDGKLTTANVYGGPSALSDGLFASLSVSP